MQPCFFFRYKSGGALEAHFGLGKATRAEVMEKETRFWTQSNRRILHDLVIGTRYHDIADREQIRLGAVKLRVHRIRMLLRAKLGAILAEVRSERA